MCFVTACRHGGKLLGEYMHPPITMSAVPMALSMPGWESSDHAAVGRHLADGVRMVADAGADFYVCPDNTAHIVLETIAASLPIPGLHIAEVVAAEIAQRGWRGVGLLGTKWTMDGPVYERVLRERGLRRILASEATRARVQAAIFEELCHGVVTERTTAMFVGAVEELQRAGAECVVLGCTEIPLVLNEGNSALPPVDSTRLLARRAVEVCVRSGTLAVRGGWVEL